MQKTHYLQQEFCKQLAAIPPDTRPLFGKMNVLQMVEHMGYAFQQASGRIPLDPVHDEATTEKMYAFMISERPFKDNTPNPYLPDEPDAPKHITLPDAIASLQRDIDYFFQHFQHQPDARVLNPFFGNLTFEEWVHLLHKHAAHHLRQFGVSIQAQS